MNLRERAVTDMKNLNLKDWGLPVIFIGPDGVKYETDNETGETLKALQILYNRTKVDPDDGSEIVVPEPMVCMARSSLAVIPASGETWIIRMPKDPSPSAPLFDFVLSEVRAPEGGRSLGFIRFYPQEAEQS